MKALSAVVVLVAVAGLPRATAPASGQAAVIGVIERVAFEPNAEAPERVQIWGAFAVAEYIANQGGFTGHYGRAARGYLYFKLPPASKEAENARREWSDLKSVAGTNQGVAFAYADRNRGDNIQIRMTGTPATAPDVYRTDIGVTKFSRTSPMQSFIDLLVRMIEG